MADLIGVDVFVAAVEAGGRYVGAYGQFRTDYALSSHIALALEFVHFSVGPTIVSAAVMIRTILVRIYAMAGK